MRSPTDRASSASPTAAADLPAAADLHYVSDHVPGIGRRLRRGKFVYFGPDRQPLRDPLQIARINRLAIPPAYRDVWICTDPRGHLQARAGPEKSATRRNYDRLLSFARALPKIRAAIEAHLAEPGLGRNKLMATVVALLDQTLIRIGNPRYARENRSFGLTTLRTQHVAVNGHAIEFRFKGKSGVEHRLQLSDPRLARILKRCQELPGQQLLQYLDDAGQPHTVTSQDVNDYLRTHGEGDFTAKARPGMALFTRPIEKYARPGAAPCRPAAVSGTACRLLVMHS